MISGTADAVTINFFDSSQMATLVATGDTYDTISSNGYIFTYTRDKLFDGGNGRPIRVPWPNGVEAQAITVGQVGKAQITISRVDGSIFAIPAFTAKLLANTVGAGGAIEVMPMLNGEDAFSDPLAFNATGNANQTFSYNAGTTPSTSLLTGFDTYKFSLYVDFALTGITLVDAGIPSPVATFTVNVSDASAVAIAGEDVAVNHPGTAPQTADTDGRAAYEVEPL